MLVTRANQIEYSLLHHHHHRHQRPRSRWVRVRAKTGRSMGRCLISSAVTTLKFSQTPKSILPSSNRHPKLLSPHHTFTAPPITRQLGFCSTLPFKASPIRRGLSTKAVLSEISNQKQFFKIGADSTGPVPPDQLLRVVEAAAKTGAEVCMKLKSIGFWLGIIYLCSSVLP